MVKSDSGTYFAQDLQKSQGGDTIRSLRHIGVQIA